MGLAAAKLSHQGDVDEERIYHGDSESEEEIEDETLQSTRRSPSNSALIQATKQGDLSLVIQLIHAGETSQRCQQLCARMATSRGCVDIMKFLMQQQSGVASRSKHGYTPLKLAKMYQHPDAIDYLVHTLGMKDEAREEEEKTQSSIALSSPPGNPPQGFHFLTEFDLPPPVVSPRTRASSNPTVASPSKPQPPLRPVFKPRSRANVMMRNRFQKFRLDGKYDQEEGGEDDVEVLAKTYVHVKKEEEKEGNDLETSVSPDVPLAPPLDVSCSSPVPIAPPISSEIPIPPPLAPSLLSSCSSPPPQHPISSIPLKPLHWDVLPSDHTSINQDEHSLWSELARNKNRKSLNEDVQVHATQLEALFAKKAPVVKMKAATPAVSAAKQPISKPTSADIIDTKRSNNIEISLRRLKLSWIQIRDALLSINKEVLTQETMQALMNCSPQGQNGQEEVKRILDEGERSRKDGKVMIQLSPSSTNTGYSHMNYAENYFLFMCSSIPRLQTRLKLIEFMLFRFPSLSQEAETQIQTLVQAVAEIKSSENLKRLMDVVLTVGNYLNSGAAASSGRYAPASGFRLSSLSKLQDTRSSDGKTSLLDYIVGYVEDKFVNGCEGERTIAAVEESSNIKSPSTSASSTITTPPSFLSSLSCMRPASLIDLSHLEREVQRAESSLKLCAIQLANEPKVIGSAANGDSAPSGSGSEPEDRFYRVMHEFHSTASSRLISLQSSLTSCRSLTHSLISYFGEDSQKMEVTTFFSLMLGFMDAYQSVEDRVREVKRKKQSEAAAVAGKMQLQQRRSALRNRPSESTRE